MSPDTHLRVKPVMLHHLSAERGSERFAPAVLPWIPEARAPYLDWLPGAVGTPESIERWMLYRAAGSEVTPELIVPQASLSNVAMRLER